MKRPLIIVLSVLALTGLIGYPVASWFIGTQVETTLDQQYKDLNGLLPFIKLSDRKYERGVFTSRETDTATLTLASLEPIQFTIHSEIRHGPFPGISLIAAATIDSVIEVKEGFKQDVAGWVGDGKLLSMHTTLRLDGSGGDSLINIPAINAAGISLDGMSAKVNFARDFVNYSLHCDMPRLEVNSQAGFALQAEGLHFDSEQRRIFDDEPLLFSGTTRLTIAKLNVDASSQGTVAIPFMPLAIQDLALDETSALNDGEFVDYSSKLGTEVIKLGDQNFGPAHLDSSFHHLHARTVANLYRAYLENRDKNSLHSLNNAEWASSLSLLTQELIAHNAEFRLDRFSVTRPQGEALLSASIKFKDATSGDFANRQALLSKLYASIDIRIPEDILPQLFQAKFANPEQAQDRIKAGVAALVAQGYLTQESGTIKTRLEIHDGQQWFNGKPYAQPVVAMLTDNPPATAPFSPSYSGMPEAARRLNCTACHAIDRKVVGPAWMDVSKRYRDAPSFEYQGRQYPVEEGLLLKVSRGGAGHWGFMPMPAIDPAGRSQNDIRALVRYILDLSKTEVPQINRVDVVPPYKMGETLESFMADAKVHGISGAAIDLHSRTVGGENTSVSFMASGIRLFFSNSGQHNLKTIRFDSPYSGKLRGVGIGANLFQLNNALGSPLRPPWRYANYKAYLFDGDANTYVRFDLMDGVVKTMFVLGK